jgi:hypothetical protein
MRLSLLRYFAWISLVFLAAVSCRSGIELCGEQACKIHESLFNGSFEKITFKTKVIFRERELSGLIMIKNTSNKSYKIAFYNELGLTYLEGTYENSSDHKKLIIKNIAPVINYKIFVKNFEKCLHTVFDDKVNLHLPNFVLPGNNESTLVVELRNGFLLELSPLTSN